MTDGKTKSSFLDLIHRFLMLVFYRLVLMVPIKNVKNVSSKLVDRIQA